MFIKIRKERFGYIFFDRNSRNHHFVETKEKLESMDNNQIAAYLAKFFRFNPPEIKWEFIFPKNHETPLSAPIGMYLEISPLCNLNCGHCYKPKSELKVPLSLLQFKKLIDNLHEMGIFEIRICGNEPTTSPFLFEIAEYIKAKDMYLGINTNAYFDDDFQEQMVGIQPDFIAISIDGNQKTHDAIRKNGSYDRAVSFLARLSNEPLKRRINSIVSKLTIEVMENTAILASKFKAEVSFIPFRPIGKNDAFKKLNVIDKNDMLRSVREVMRLREKYPNVTIMTYFDILSDKATYHHSMPFNSPCPSRKNGFITHDGNFFPCDFLRYLGDKFYCGNVAKTEFWKLWNNSATLHNFQNIKHDRCQECRFYLMHCHGGCISGSLSDPSNPKDELCFIDILK